MKVIGVFRVNEVCNLKWTATCVLFFFKQFYLLSIIFYVQIAKQKRQFYRLQGDIFILLGVSHQ